MASLESAKLVCHSAMYIVGISIMVAYSFCWLRTYNKNDMIQCENIHSNVYIDAKCSSINEYSD